MISRELGDHAPRPERFVALDFETATCDSDSACALGVVVVQGSRIVRRRRWLMRPPHRLGQVELLGHRPRRLADLGALAR
jgi:DNA polymerase III epsilon subunit-like protein